MSDQTPVPDLPPNLDRASAATAASTTDDLDQFRVDQGYSTMVNAKLALSVVPVRKPAKTQWVNVLDPATWRFVAPIFIDPADSSTHMLTPAIAATLDDGLARVVDMFAYVDRAGVIAIWTISQPNIDGGDNPWNESAREIATTKNGRWIRVHASRPHGAYLYTPAPVEFPAPELPKVTMRELVKIAFKGRMISTPDHAVLRRLRGEV